MAFITNLPTRFQPIIGAQVSLGARTTASAIEAPWFADFSFNFAGGAIGPVAIPASGQPPGNVYLENPLVNLSVAPASAAPYRYRGISPAPQLPGRPIAAPTSTQRPIRPPPRPIKPASIIPKPLLTSNIQSRIPGLIRTAG